MGVIPMAKTRNKKIGRPRTSPLWKLKLEEQFFFKRCQGQDIKHLSLTVLRQQNYLHRVTEMRFRLRTFISGIRVVRVL